MGLKQLAINRGIATGKTSTSRYHSKDSAGTSSTDGASTFSQASGSNASKPSEKGDLESSLKAFENIVAELRVSETGEKGKDRGKGGRKGLGKGSDGGRGIGKSRLLDTQTLIAEFIARIRCKHYGKTSRYSDHCFKSRKQQRFERLKAFVKQQGISEEDAMKVLAEMKKGSLRFSRLLKLGPANLCP